jgi:hypothetical protein
VIPLRLFVASLLGWFQRDLHEIILYLREENRVLKAQSAARAGWLDVHLYTENFLL